MFDDQPSQPPDDEAVPLADLVGQPGAAGSRPMQVIEADAPEKLKRKRKPKRDFANLRLYLVVAGIAVVVTAVVAGVFLLVVPPRVVEMTVPVVITATPMPYPWPTPTAAFGDGIGKSGYDYLTLENLHANLPANTRVRLSIGWFDGQQWHYEVVSQGEQSYGEALESQLAFVPMSFDLTLTPSAVPWPTFTLPPGAG